MRLADGTWVSKPASKGTDWRVHGVFDLGSGGFSHLELTDEHGAEAWSAVRRSRARSGSATTIMPGCRF